MRNPEGTPIWYELLTNDAAAARAFYESVVGWKMHPPPPGDPKHYWMIDAPDAHVAGMMQLTEAMRAKGARPTWLFYLGVEDVDATVARATAAGAQVLMPAFDIPDVGRIAMLGDPQGIPFYVMRGSSEHASTAFQRTGMGRCNWNELSTPDPASANAFYAKVFGWKLAESMKLPDGGAYTFADAGETRIGATMKQATGAPPGWMFYFRTPDIEAAAARVKAGGGKVHAGPMEVPGGDKVIVASDPEGTPFGIAAPGKAG